MACRTSNSVRSYGVQEKIASVANVRRNLQPIGSDIALGLWERTGGGSIDYGVPDHHTLSVYVAGGRGVRCLSGRETTEYGQPGTLCILPANRESRWTNHDYVSMLHLYFSAAAFERVTESQLKIDASQNFVRDPLMFGLVSSFVLGLNWDDETSTGALEHAVFAMMNRMTCYGQQKRKAGMQGKLSKSKKLDVLQYLDENLQGHISVADIACFLGMSERSTSREIHGTFGVAPYQLVLQRRAEQAAKHIEVGMSLADAAALSGFSSQSHMARQLKTNFGVTPSYFAKQRP